MTVFILKAFNFFFITVALSSQLHVPPWISGLYVLRYRGYSTKYGIFYIGFCKSYTVWEPSVAKFEKSFRTPESVLKSEFINRNFCQAVTYVKGCFRYQNKIILFNSLTSSKTNNQTKIYFLSQWFNYKVN